MKKLLIALLALSVAGTAFAADPAFTFSGALKTGMTFASSDATSATEDGMVLLQSDDVGDNVPVRVELVGAYTDGDFGVKFRLRSNYEDALSFSYGYAWGNLFSNMVTFKVGKVDDGAWETEGDEGFDVADGNGLQVQVKPVAGLNAGVKFNAPVATANGTYTAWTYEQFGNEVALGLGYTSDMFNFQAGYQMDSDADDAGSEDFAKAYFGVNYKGLKGLTAIAEGRLGALGDADLGWKEFNETVEYAVNEQLSVGVLAWQTMFGELYVGGAIKDVLTGASVADDSLLYSVKPYANYKLNDKTTLGLSVEYAAQGDATSMTVKPSATVQLAPKAKFVGFYAYNTADDTADTVNTQTIQLDFIYSF